MHDLYSEMQQRYEDHDLPWDVPLPPPEVLALAERLVHLSGDPYRVR